LRYRQIVVYWGVLAAVAQVGGGRSSLAEASEDGQAAFVFFDKTGKMGEKRMKDEI
jgi:hypothetical protein